MGGRPMSLQDNAVHSGSWVLWPPSIMAGGTPQEREAENEELSCSDISERYVRDVCCVTRRVFEHLLFPNGVNGISMRLLWELLRGITVQKLRDCIGFIVWKPAIRRNTLTQCFWCLANGWLESGDKREGNVCNSFCLWRLMPPRQEHPRSMQCGENLSLYQNDSGSAFVFSILKIYQPWTLSMDFPSAKTNPSDH